MANVPEGQRNLSHAHAQLAESIDEVQQNTAVIMAPTLQQVQQQLSGLQQQLQQQLDGVQETVTGLGLRLTRVEWVQRNSPRRATNSVRPINLLPLYKERYGGQHPMGTLPQAVGISVPNTRALLFEMTHESLNEIETFYQETFGGENSREDIAARMDAFYEFLMQSS